MIRFIPFLIILSIPPFHATAAVLNNNRLAVNCTGSTYAVNSQYQTNLNNLLSSLTARSPSSSNSNATIGTSDDQVYGLYICDGDLSPVDCQTCVQSATTDITAIAATESCQSSRQAIIWYDYCMLRYSDENFFGVPDTNGFNMTNPDTSQTISSPVPYQMVSNLVQVAPFRRPMFAFNASTSISSYAMAQCTGDLTSAGCSHCLSTILGNIKECCTHSNGWRYMSASCKIRYEGYAFLRNLNASNTQFIEYACSASNNFQSSYKLNTFLSDVTAKATPTGFYNGTQSELFGLALCRGDLLSDDCNNCLTHASTKLTTNYCTNRTRGTIWYDNKCIVRYSNESFFGVVDYGKSYCGFDQVSIEDGNNNVEFVTALVGVAANNTRMFAVNDTKVGSAQPGYALLQCSRDLSSDGCQRCLQYGMSVVNRDCKQTNGWWYLSGSCIIIYGDIAFFNTSALGIGAPTPQLAPQPLLPKAGRGGKQKSSKKVAVILGPILGAILMGTLLFLSCWILKKRNAKRDKLDGPEPVGQPSNMDFLFVDLATIQAATCDFSDANKLGEGGFGTVYKGTLSNGQEIAVKRLSTKSKQGASEFKNEMKLIAKLQHRNLVRVLGCCVEREEKLLIYEYLPNKSLDAFIFDENKRSQLDWTRRRLIIAGIAKGLLFLHEDFLLKVIHRDLKASNILLDNGMNPKISDFGMAKIFETDETEVYSGRVVGTLGYMAPEYAMEGIFSEKSDVYSFGVLLLEIVSGQKNGRSHFDRHGQTLLRRAWQLWSGGRAMELIDVLLGDSYPQAEMMRVVHIGLLCVQEDVKKRPTMSSVVLMLISDQMLLPKPTQPPTFFRQRTLESDLNSSTMTTSSTKGPSINEVTITEPTPR